MIQTKVVNSYQWNMIKLL